MEREITPPAPRDANTALVRFLLTLLLGFCRHAA